MQIQINTDHNIKGYETVAERVRDAVAGSLSHFSEHITRVEVHLSDENAKKNMNNDKRCLMEVRLEGRQPVAVSDQADSLAQAIDGAAEKMSHLLESTFGRLHNHRNHLVDPVATDMAALETSLPDA